MSDYAANIERRTYGTGRRAEIVKRRADALARVLPHDEAVAQARWELNRAIARALDNGAPRVEIARFLGVSPVRVGHLRGRARLNRTPPLMLPPLPDGPAH